MRLRNDRRVTRKEEGTERNTKWAALSPAEKLKSLDARLGVGVGAKRQRKLLTGDK